MILKNSITELIWITLVIFYTIEKSFQSDLTYIIILILGIIVATTLATKHKTISRAILYSDNKDRSGLTIVKLTGELNLKRALKLISIYSFLGGARGAIIIAAGVTNNYSIPIILVGTIYIYINIHISGLKKHLEEQFD